MPMVSADRAATYMPEVSPASAAASVFLAGRVHKAAPSIHAWCLHTSLCLFGFLASASPDSPRSATSSASCPLDARTAGMLSQSTRLCSNCPFDLCSCNTGHGLRNLMPIVSARLQLRHAPAYTGHSNSSGIALAHRPSARAPGNLCARRAGSPPRGPSFRMHTPARRISRSERSARQRALGEGAQAVLRARTHGHELSTTFLHRRYLTVLRPVALYNAAQIARVHHHHGVSVVRAFWPWAAVWASRSMGRESLLLKTTLFRSGKQIFLEGLI
jgi:hypothetical protein